MSHAKLILLVVVLGTSHGQEMSQHQESKSTGILGMSWQVQGALEQCRHEKDEVKVQETKIKKKKNSPGV